jgi:hypothetical protein
VRPAGGVGPGLLPVALAMAIAGAAASLPGEPRSGAAAAAEGSGLRSVASFDGIADPARRSAALFTEAGKVLLHPRCVNCHPAGDRPGQGDAGRPHEPRVRRGTAGHGVTAMHCSACHTAANFDPAGVPGNPHWRLAPASMAWEGRSLSEICEQVKDPARNGRRSLRQVVEHMRADPLVAWAWAPGVGREPAPGTQKAFAALIEAWARTGAACPEP